MIHYDAQLEALLKNFRTEAQDIFEEWLVWHTLQEEKLAAKIEKWFAKQQSDTLDALDVLEGVYDNTRKTAQFIDMLLNTRLIPVQRFKHIGIFRFSSYTFPVQLNNALRKAGDPIGDAINVIATVRPEGVKTALSNAGKTAMKGGGQSALNTMRIGLEFQILDKGALQSLEDYYLKLSDQLAESLSSKIKYELAEGIRNFEGIPEIRDRILSVYDKPVTVVVPPKVGPDGTVIRQGYSYDMNAKVWAATVARTEITRAFVAGRLEAYRQSKVVKEVQFMTAGDERVCSECSVLDYAVYTLEEATAMIPIHGNCRCTWIPYIDAASLDEELGLAAQNVEDAYSTEGA